MEDSRVVVMLYDPSVTIACFMWYPFVTNRFGLFCFKHQIRLRNQSRSIIFSKSVLPSRSYMRAYGNSEVVDPEVCS